MKVAIVGTGYVGLVTGTCFAEMGNDVWCIDVDEEKIANLKKGVIPIYEPGLSEMVRQNQQTGSLHFTTDLSEALKVSDVLFIAVGTPMGEDGSADLHYVLDVAETIGKFMDHPMVIVDKSTVPVGTAEKVRSAIQEQLKKRDIDITFDMVSNPEFLKEGSAVNDCMKPDRIVIGVDNAHASEVMTELYKPYVMNTENFILMDIPSAEMTKYAANAMLATKISFINEISNICERVGANVNLVRRGIGSDHRIGYSFIYPGCGYGGSCFPKDVQALIKTAGEHSYTPSLLQAVESVNREQKMRIPEKIINRFGENLSGKIFAVWGLSFKPDTDDMRESPAITVIRELINHGASIQAYDPKAMNEAESCYLEGMERVHYCNSKYDALNNAEAMILLTEWKEFRSPDFYEMKRRLKSPAIFDGRNQYDARRLVKFGFDYFPIGSKGYLAREEANS